MQWPLFGDTKENMTIIRLQNYEPEEPYWVGFSGGKDSTVLLDLVKRSGVPYEAHYNLTTVDPPEVVQFIKKEYPEVIIDRPEQTMWELIVKKRFPPTQRMRYCCEILKERAVPNGRVLVTGIRSEESTARKNRAMFESCDGHVRRSVAGNRKLHTFYLHPIIDWTEEEIWDYIHEHDLPYCSLYDEGMKRVGCVMCPMKGSRLMAQDAARWPKIAAAYERSICKAFDQAVADGLDRHGWQDGHDQYKWWISKDAKKYGDDDSFSLFGEEQD